MSILSPPALQLGDRAKRDQLKWEFQRLWKSPSPPIPLDVEAVMYLTGPYRSIHHKENWVRMHHTAAVVRHLAEQDSLPLVILSGEIEEWEAMVCMARKAKIPEAGIYVQPCGRRGQANTTSHFTTFMKDPITRELQRVVLVTSTYHVPRVQRTASKLLPSTTDFIVTSDRADIAICPPEQYQGGEIRRIIEYSRKGDIDLTPRPHRWLPSARLPQTVS